MIIKYKIVFIYQQKCSWAFTKFGTEWYGLNVLSLKSILFLDTTKIWMQNLWAKFVSYDHPLLSWLVVHRFLFIVLPYSVSTNLLIHKQIIDNCIYNTNTNVYQVFFQ